MRNLALLALALSLALVLVHGLLRGDWLQALLAGIALAMAMLPEEYPVVLTVFPALGARRLSKRRRADAAHQRDRDAGRHHGAVHRQDRHADREPHDGDAPGGRRRRRWTSGSTVPARRRAKLPEAFHALVEVSILASVVDPFDPMEKAFHQLGQRFLAETEHLHHDWTLVQTYALSPALRAMSHVWTAHGDGAQVVAAKGAPEAVIDLCHLDAAAQARIAAAVDALAAEGLRVLAVARGRFDGQDWPADRARLRLRVRRPARPGRPAARRGARARWPSAARPASAW